MIFEYILFFIFCVLVTLSKFKNKDVILIISLTVLSIGAGLREIRWADTDAYTISFTNFTPTLVELSIDSKPLGYAELGFFWLSCLIKTISGNPQVYLGAVAGISLFFLYKDLKKYSIMPLIGLCAYIARFFMGRNLVQIRAGLAYLIVLWGIKYIQEKKFWHYFILVWLASLIHFSSWIALPLYFIHNWLPINKKTILFGLGIAFILGAFFQEPISMFVTDQANDLNIATTYVQDSYVTKAQGLSNPMIYFQCFLLLAYTFLENRLIINTRYYYVIRCGYFYSTLILIIFCSFTALSGRTSTMFATLEFAVIPSLVYLFNRKNRIIAFFIMGVLLSTIFYLNIPNIFK